MKKRLLYPMVLLLFAVTSCTGYAFAASNESAPFQAGEGAGAISGWTISNVHYQLAADPSRLSAVEFDLDQPAAVVKVSFDGAAAEYFECANPYALHWVCSVQGRVTLQAINGLRVIALGGK